MVIIMRSHNLFALLALTCTQFAFAQSSITPSGDPVSGSAVISELNLARQNPALYAGFLEDLRSHYNGNLLALPDRPKTYTKEGVRAVDEAIRFLRSTKPLAPLILSPGMSKGAADHCADQASGRLGHGGSDGSNPGQRMGRYGMWGASWGENISYGKTTARDIVIQLIVDDGLRARKHRKNIFNPNFNYAGAGYGPHAVYRTVCNIDFAGAYAERDSGLFARNY